MDPRVFDWYAILTQACIFIIFYFIRARTLFLLGCILIIVSFAALSLGSVAWERPSQWLVTNCGFQLSAFGLLMVRTMLVRSVSLRLLGRIAAGQSGSITEEVAHRLNDLRRFGLTTRVDGKNSLTRLGRAISTVVAVLYALSRIRL